MPINLVNDANSPVRIKSPFGDDLVVESMTGEEELGRPFVYNLSLLSNNPDLQFSEMVGKTVTVSLNLYQGKRYFHGHVSEFSCDVPDEGFVRYSAVVRPWFWLLTQTADCRIFQNKSVPEIIKEIFRDNGMKDFRDALISTYQAKVYSVQYRESDFNFISRLMESEGIYYYFEHDDGKHTMVLVDDQNTHKPFPAHDKVSYLIGVDRDERAGSLDFWTAKQSIMPNKYASRDFNFETPKVDLLSKFNQPVEYSSISDSEVYDYPGEYSQKGEGSDYAKIRLQEIQCQQERLHAGGTYRGISAGHSLTLENHFRTDQNIEYLVVSVSHNINNSDFVTKNATAQELYRCQAELINKKVPFRTARTTRKPVVQGPQTAIVVGPGGEEIHTDKYGRVKVQFHWDRLGEDDDNSSCWVRVSQLWAGMKWGAIHIPRIGQEVIVSFMEGDPDQPIITGRVYNADYMPPYTLPENKTQSGIKSRSSKEGNAENFNELRFEDKKGEEEIYLHAEHDLTTYVENDEDRTTINTRKVYVGDKDNKRPEETIESMVVQGERLITIYGNDGLSVAEGSKGRKVHILDGNYELLVDKADYIHTLMKGDSTVTLEKGNSTTKIDQKIITESAKGDISTEAKLGEISLKAMKKITLTVGASSITIDPSSITIKAPMVKVEGSGKVDVTSAMTTVDGTGMLTLKGGLTKIN